MQQTQKYKLNLIESSDPFLPDGLNQNTQKVEQVLSQNLGSMRTDLDAVMAGLGSGGKTARIAWGSYRGNDKSGKAHPNKLTFDFCPVILVMCEGVMSRGSGRAVINYAGRDYSQIVDWTDNGVSWYYPGSQYDDPGPQLNAYDDGDYYYVVIGYDLNS